MEPLSVIASVIALAQAVQGVTKATKYVASISNPSLEICRLQNELRLVEGYLQSLNPILDAYKDHAKPVRNVDTTHLEASITDLKGEMSGLDVFLTRFKPGASDSASRRVARMVSWRNHRDKLVRLCDSLQSKRMNLAHAVGLLQSSIGLSHSSMLLLMRDETVSGIAQLSTQIMQTTIAAPSPPPPTLSVSSSDSTLCGPTEGEPVAAHSPVQDQPKVEPSQRPVSVLTTLAFGCAPTCRCRCHAKSELSTPRLLSNVLGRIVVTCTGMPVRFGNACSHPTCSAVAGSIRVALRFPAWMVQRAVSARLSWNSVLNSGASLHLKIRRTIPNSHEVWSTIWNHDLVGLQGLLSQRVVHPSDVTFDFGDGLLQYAIRGALVRSPYPGAIWEIIQLLMELDPEVSREDYIGRSPISHLARMMLSLSNPPRELEALTRKAIALAGDEFYDRNTVIHDAIFGRGKLTLDEALAVEPQSINSLDTAGHSPLHWAVQRNDVRAVQTLLAWGASVDLPDGGEKQTALHIAAMCDNVTLAQVLVDAGADINYRDAYGQSALFYAASSGAVDLVSLCIARGGDVHVQGLYGAPTILQCAISPRTHSKDEATIAAIIQQLSRAGIDLDHPLQDGVTPLMDAIYDNSPGAFRALLAEGARVEKQDDNGWTVLHHAACFANSAMIQALGYSDLSMVDPDILNSTGLTALDLLEERITEIGEDVEGTAIFDSFQKLIAVVKVQYSERLCRESTQRYQDEDDSETETYHDAAEKL